MTSVKNKIRGGTVFLFLLLLLTGGFSTYYLAKTRQASANILKANYESLAYAHQMQTALDSVRQGHRAYADTFNRYLRLQQNNITEPGERKATQSLAQTATGIVDDTLLQRGAGFWLQRILQLNMAAIQQKTEASEASAGEALRFLITIVAIIFVVGFTFAANFPSVVTGPLRKLTDAIKAIGQRQYGQRIHIQSKDEFGELANAFNEMAERLEYFESSNLNKILFEKSRAEAVINSLKDASIGIDKTDVVLFANNQALGLLGLSAKDIVGRPAAEVATRNDLFRFLLNDAGTAPFKIVVDGRENYFTKETTEVVQEESGAKVIVLKNITSFKELDVAKTNFIATVSHELKTPLASSDFSLKLLADERIGTLSAEQKELVQNLKADNGRMIRILSELLNLSQVEAGKISLHIGAIDPYRVVQNSADAVVTAAKAKNLTIEKRFQDGLPHVQADGDKVAWVLNNFLTNAIKYAPSQSTITIAVAQLDGQLVFTVADKGPGIEAVHLSRIFERYYQVPGRSNKTGSGIGLAISKELVEAMGGNVWVKSSIGEGSTFGFGLPL